MELNFMESKLQRIQYRLIKTFNESPSIEEATVRYLKIICQNLGWAGGKISMLDQSLHALQATSYYWFLKEHFEVDIQDALAPVWKSGKIYWVVDIRQSTLNEGQKNRLIKMKINSLLGMPIYFQNTILGVAVFFSCSIAKPNFSLLALFLFAGEQFGMFLKRKQIEMQHSVLEERLRLKNLELEEQAAYLRMASQAKSMFLANMSHELRTPLNSIIGFTELLYKEKVGPISAEHKDYLGEVVTNAHHLLDLLNDLLDITKIEAGKMELHPTPTLIAEVVEDVYKSMQMSIKQKNIQFDVLVAPEFNKEILMDVGKLKQILFNYISNAIKFTGENGKIVVRVTLKNPTSFKIAVTDTGIGIHPQDIEKLFVVFQQLNLSYSKLHQGMGLGLALTRNIVELLGGSVGVESQIGKGSTFFAILPFTFAPVPALEGGHHGK